MGKLSRVLKIAALTGAVLVLLALGAASMPAHAQNLNNGTTLTLRNPLGASCNDLTCPVSAVANFLFTISIPICAIMVLVGGFQMMTAAGEPEKISKGRKTIMWAVIGFVVVLLAGSVASLIQSLFGASS